MSTLVIVGGGHAAAQLCGALAEARKQGLFNDRIVLVSEEAHLPYHRPPLSKGLWFGKDKLDDLSVHDDAWYREQRADLQRRREVVELDAESRRVWDDHGLMVIDSALIYSIVDVLLGGRRGTSALRVEGRPYTTIETKLIERMGPDELLD